MRRTRYFATCFVLLLTTAAFAGEVIDGVVASVNRHPILRSDWDEAVRFEAFMQQKPVSQITPNERRLALQRLIDRQLLEAQMGASGHLQPSETRLQDDLAKLRAQLPNAKNDEVWGQLLAGYGLTEPSLKRHLRDEIQVMNFVEVRLRPNVRIHDDDVTSYYRDQLVPDMEKTGSKMVPLADVKDKIHEVLTQQHIDELLDAWLHNLRQQAQIRSSVKLPGINAPENEGGVAGSN